MKGPIGLSPAHKLCDADSLTILLRCICRTWWHCILARSTQRRAVLCDDIAGCCLREVGRPESRHSEGAGTWEQAATAAAQGVKPQDITDMGFGVGINLANGHDSIVKYSAVPHSYGS